MIKIHSLKRTYNAVLIAWSKVLRHRLILIHLHLTKTLIFWHPTTRHAADGLSECRSSSSIRAKSLRICRLPITGSERRHWNKRSHVAAIKLKSVLKSNTLYSFKIIWRSLINWLIDWLTQHTFTNESRKWRRKKSNLQQAYTRRKVAELEHIWHWCCFLPLSGNGVFASKHNLIKLRLANGILSFDLQIVESVIIVFRGRRKIMEKKNRESRYFISSISGELNQIRRCGCVARNSY